ncbi:MAG: SRPBCC domain-containing protein, partial [Rhizomicrobium sp.]
MKKQFERAARRLGAVAFAAALGTTAQAAVTDIAPGGFALTETAHIAAPRHKVYAALIEPSHWWSSAHSFSGNAANFTFDARAGGCWCETLPNGGSVDFMTVVYAAPGDTLRLKGAIGPFQAFAVDGVMTWTLKDSGQGTDLTL